MKILYIALCDLWANGEVGIKTKVFSQIKCLQKEHEMYLVTLKDMMFCTYKYDRLINKQVILSVDEMYEQIRTFINDQKIEVIYLRYLQTNFWLNLFLKNLKKQNKLVIIDFPTIPYDMEINGRVELEEDQLYRNKIKKYVKYSTNYNGLNSVFGIPSIALHNGINIEEIPLKKDSKNFDITLIAVATMNFWHGYDRLIRGMAEYYKEDVPQKVYLKLVGLGKEVPRYQDLIQENNLQQYIELVGIKCGAELTEEFNKADIAVGALGGYRKKMKEDSAIKTKEYCARGMPIILGINDLAFEEEHDFIHRVPNDESVVNVADIIRFYECFQKKSNKEEIRNYAQKYLTWERQFEKLFISIGLR